MDEDEARSAVACLLELHSAPAIEGCIDAVITQADIWQMLRVSSLKKIEELHKKVLAMRQSIKSDVRSEIVTDHDLRRAIGA